ncbi:RNA 2',3'-cyclic phosphodiesterase [Aeoliella sp.]|uniref:RNA 2',3'-cyclic phosphodiesterase n=1 Tax=Aeoliella sp. TaxID=2795800 RepID=UPI003CCC2BBC
MSKTRTFIAIEPSPDVVGHAERALLRLRRLADNVKWVERGNLHWTLHFLGEIDDQELYDVCQAVERGAAEVEPFTLEAAGVGAFPSQSRPRTLWIGAGAGGEAMELLHSKLQEQLEPLGFRGENRRFVPHLTLGRAGRGLRPAETAALAEELEKLVDFPAGNQVVDELTIFASRLRREGAEYTPVAHVPLAG